MTPGSFYFSGGFASFRGYTKRIAAAIATLLKDLGGEICLLDWGEGMPFTSFNHRSLRPTVLINNALTVTLVRESFVRKTMMKRVVAIEDNPLVLPLPRSKAEPVGQDIQESREIRMPLLLKIHGVSLCAAVLCLHSAEGHPEGIGENPE